MLQWTSRCCNVFLIDYCYCYYYHYLDDDISDLASSSSSSTDSHSSAALVNPVGSATQISNLADDKLLQETILKVRRESQNEAFNLGKCKIETCHRQS